MRIIRSMMAAALCILAIEAPAAVLLETTSLVATTEEAQASLPAPLSFTVTQAGRYTITLRDLQTPENLSRLEAAVTRNLVRVAAVEVQAVTGGTPQPASVSFTAEAGEYQVHVVGTPATGEAGGAFGVVVAPTDGGAALLDAADVIAVESQPAADQAVLRQALSLPVAGRYSVALTDLSFAPTQTTLQALVLREVPTGVEPIVVDAGGFDAPVSGDYELIILAKATGGDLAGLYNVRVTGPQAQAIFQSVQPVGRTRAPSALTFPAVGQYTLSATDLRFPSALASFGAVIVQSGAAIGRVTDDLPKTVTAAAGTAQLFSIGVASAIDEVGAFAVAVKQGSTVIASSLRTVDNSDDPAKPSIYRFDAASVAAGVHSLNLEDLRFPAPLPLLKAAVIQNATVIHEQNAAGVANVTLAAGDGQVLVATRAPAASGNGLFSVRLLPPTGQAVVQGTQGVGGLFQSLPLTVATTGVYDIALTDLEFPSELQSAALAVTQGSTVIGQVLGDGVIPRQQLTAGTYALYFLGQPALGAGFGLYGLRVADAAPTPTVTLTATPTSVTSGQTTSLQWTATNATACTASGGWSGAKATNGTQTSDALTAAATFTITCTGAGGSATASASVSVTQPGSGGGGGGDGGGGAFGALFCVLLGIAVATRRAVRQQRA
ncbi:hypothetical protein HNQ60_000114 [Povalibacter uvarum]|uniref:Ig-like domain-containing protein n=1 Tax=Povalibacter uvarum TaxID=732238 RepID=A0A841HG38_9GAMM|nr:hypothetical protein [Povalibacter uvarum]MBB6091268.1 hypothetical protein [Povalibacter uvarum]